MGKPATHTDPNGWTWIFRNNKTTNSKPIGNPYHSDVDKVATSFYVTNFPDSIDARGLWNTCTPYGRLVDAFIANKRSKAGKRFGFIRYLGVIDASDFVRSLSNIWQQSFASIVHGNLKPKPTNVNAFHDITRAVSLDDRELIGVDDTSRVLLVKLKDLDSASNMYVICKNEGFVDLKIHHVGGSWIWIQFPSPEACENFRLNATMTNISSAIRTVTPSFKVDERLIWIEISGLPLCAWGSNAFKKVACLFGKFMFFEVEQSTSMSTGRVCISTKSHQPVSEKVKVEVHGEIFEILVHEIGTWSISIEDEALDSSSTEDENDIEKVADTFEENSVDDLDEITKNLNKEKEDIETNEEPSNNSAVDLQHAKETDTSDLSRPPGFENFKRGSSSRCSTSFPRSRNKDIKGISFIHELSRLIEVGSSLGLDIRGCRRSLNQMINGIGAHIVDK
ncbi:hypothetical protein CTI12_AA322610 [Artemisia annua]|uniref:RRM domain-containing protein n=1 Tax=Artemisia annua TaxID=35608 RepID=A0A2U1N0L0_ARTAN|nr:hypothetical protein CTI12_AA322610 [Artemisia annua]